MTDQRSLPRWAMIGLGLGAGLLLGLCLAPAAPPADPANRGLDASLWLQTSGEFRALCLQIYRFAGERLARRLAELPKDGLPPAVVLDLDETVFDNSPFQTWLLRNRKAYSDRDWETWESQHAREVRGVPGAAEFIAAAEKAGATAHYLSNRLEKHKAATIEALEQLGIGTKDIDRRLHLKAGESSDKSVRRAGIAKAHRIVMLVGDNLRDFSEEYKLPGDAGRDAESMRAALAARNKQVELAHRSKWGVEWIVIPNPVYGEWTRLGSVDPLAVLNPLEKLEK